MYKFKLPIGDWSGDGHRECEWFVVESNKPVEEVREVHFSAIKNQPFSIEKMCDLYEDSSLDEAGLELIRAAGLNPEDYYYDTWDDGEAGTFYYPEVEQFAQLWIDWLMKEDSSLQLTIIPDELNMLPFYGQDEKKRHISFVGYGLFR